MVKRVTLDLSKIQTESLAARQSKVTVGDLARPMSPQGSFTEFWASLPNILAGRDLKAVVQAMAAARECGANIIVGMGAHVIKVGAGPLLIQLMETGFINALAVNGACLIHDLELALVGSTSEDVAQVLGHGHFGMAKETAEFIHAAYAAWQPDDMGFAHFLGARIEADRLPHRDKSLFAAAARLKLPATAHVAIGADIIHMHPQADGAAIGRAALADFRVFASLVAGLQGGVFLNLGSAVVIPETFLKALSLVRNLGAEVSAITTATVDFLRQYRVQENVVHRPTMQGGKGYYLVGHHEILIPLLTAALLETVR